MKAQLAALEESGGGGKRGELQYYAHTLYTIMLIHYNTIHYTLIHCTLGELQAPYYHHTLYTILYYTHSYSLYYTVLYCIGELQAILITNQTTGYLHRRRGARVGARRITCRRGRVSSRCCNATRCL
jgi:hypothetical protein